MRTGCQLGWSLASKIHQNLLLDGSWAVLWPSWAVLGSSWGVLEASKGVLKGLGDAPGSSRARNNEFSTVLGGFGGGG